MGDGVAERALLARTLDVDVDPLAIARAIGEVVDQGLVEHHRLGSAEVMADMLQQVGDVVILRNGHRRLLN